MSGALQFGNVKVRPAQRQVLVDGEAVVQGARAFDVLLALIERRDHIVSKESSMVANPSVTSRVLKASRRAVELRRRLGNPQELYVALTNLARVLALRREIPECEAA